MSTPGSEDALYPSVVRRERSTGITHAPQPTSAASQTSSGHTGTSSSCHSSSSDDLNDDFAGRRDRRTAGGLGSPAERTDTRTWRSYTRSASPNGGAAPVQRRAANMNGGASREAGGRVGGGAYRTYGSPRSGSPAGESAGRSSGAGGAFLSSAYSASSPNDRPPIWRKVLYDRQPFEDNYVDPGQFLEDLRENENVQGYQYLDVVQNTFSIVQQLSIVVLFTCAFGGILMHGSSHYSLVYVDSAILVLSWVMYVKYRKDNRRRIDDSDLLIFRGDGEDVAREGGGGRSPGRSPRSSPQPQAALPTPEESVAGTTRTAAMGLSRSSSQSSVASGSAEQSSKQTPSARSPLLHQRKGPKFETRATGSSQEGASSRTTVPAAAATSAGRRSMLVKDGTDMTRSDVPPTVGYFNEFGRKVISIGSFIVLLTPVLSTLTVTYSNDTIIALSILTMALHVLTANYSYLNGYTDKFAPDLSVNSAVFGVILMASRIPSPVESGSLIAFGAFCFSLSPIARHMVKQHSNTAHQALTLLLVMLATILLAMVPVLCVLYVVAVVMIALVIPWWFVVLHSSVKNQISGPWDEAKPTNSAAAAEWANAGLLL